MAEIERDRIANSTHRRPTRGRERDGGFVELFGAKCVDTPSADLVSASRAHRQAEKNGFHKSSFVELVKT